MKKIRVIQYGLGAMGSMMARLMLQKRDLEVVGCIIQRPEKNGKDLGELLNLKKRTGVICSNRPEKAFKETDADIMLHAAVSYVPQVWKQIRPAVERGISVVTIAEEMGYPYKKYPALCKEMDTTAKRNGARILGSGINPGFAMDYLPLAMTSILHHINSIKVTRLVDFSPFGPAIQQNIGIGLTKEQFKEGIKSKKLPAHIGLPESLHMIADSLGWNIDKITETKEPVIGKKTIKNSNGTVPKGRVAGFDQRCTGYVNGKAKIILEELGRVDPKLAYSNTIQIKGTPNLAETMTVPPGQYTTTAHAVNIIPAALKAPAGLLTMKDIALAYALPDK